MTTSSQAWTEDVVQAAGAKVQIVKGGQGEPLLIFHDELGHPGWLRYHEALAQRHTLFIPSHPGYGTSEHLDWIMNMRDLAGWYLEALDELELGQVSVIGFSFGGWLAAEMASMCPQQFKKLVLVDAAGLGKGLAWYVRIASLPLVGEVLQNPSLRGTRASLKNIFYNYSLIQESFLEEIHRTRKLPEAKQAVLKMIRGAVGLRGVQKQWIMTEHLKNLDIPVLIVWGAQDKIVPVHHAYNAAREAPDVELCIFDECGHWPQLEKANEFNKVVLDFLGGP